ncbi:MAG: bifunctional homocysteine S-methyltransferase/methylenetetrahydrofolate reductase [Candidatus Marinimicrobia bacterium]|nr:bifunctional homocysteine S-methyltransferase/methylenetetrahydrofolate reductase [Candidatus Neomarinimicrobiota bacterium]
MEKDFLERLENNIVLFDGGMGTEIYDRGFFINKSYDAVTLKSPEIVREIHQNYIDAGADVIETNTFGANRDKLEKYGLEEKIEEINRRGAELALETACNKVWVAGSVGPLRRRLEPIGELTEKEVYDIFRQQIGTLIKTGVDLIILETFTDLQELLIAIKVVKEIKNIPIISQMTINQDGKSFYGHPIEVITETLDSSQTDIIGLNCTIGPRKMLPAIEKMVHLTDKPISVLPNAGFPQKVEGRNIYLSSPEYMAEYARRFVQAGARIVGGCCGTKPDHIREMAKYVKSIEISPEKIKVETVHKEDERCAPVETERKSNFASKIVNGEFTVSLELVPPAGVNVTKVLDSARELSKYDIDTINIPDGPRALTRMGAIYLAKLFIDEVGIEPILHYTARDKNLLGILSDFLGIQAIGIRNMLLITGDPPKMGDYPDATAVFDIDSIGLISILDNMNHGVDLGGNSIGKPTEYFVGAGVNPVAINMEEELNRFEKKVEAGAEYAITQPIFDVEAFNNFLDRIKHLDIPIIAGVWPLVSVKNAEFMNNELPEVTISQELMNRMKNTKTKDEALATGIQIAQETIQAIKDKVAGVQVSVPFGNIDYPLKVLEVLD